MVFHPFGALLDAKISNVIKFDRMKILNNEIQVSAVHCPNDWSFYLSSFTKVSPQLFICVPAKYSLPSAHRLYYNRPIHYSTILHLLQLSSNTELAVTTFITTMDFKVLANAQRTVATYCSWSVSKMQQQSGKEVKANKLTDHVCLQQ